MSLLTGRGAGMALTGAEFLAEELRHEDNVRTALTRYESRFRPTTLRLQAEGRGAAEEFVP